ncbi:MAG: hypothetical protein HGB12_14200 [Bacteroidetes bacterium]|nr:hypothetical protein [Bacteroidota bacterium]
MVSQYPIYQRDNPNDGRVEKIVYSPGQNATENSGFKNILLLAFAALLFGLIAIVLESIYEAFHAYKLQINVLFYRALIVSVIFALAFFAGILFLVFESKANRKVSALNTKTEALAYDELENNSDNELDDFSKLVVSVYDNLQQKGCYSQTQLALATFGNKGTHYANQLREILAEQGREF